MFCKYCGKGIDPNTMRCRSCGRPVGPLAGGTGFWDLSGGTPAGDPIADETAAGQLEELRKQIEELRGQPKTERKHNMKGSCKSCAVSAALHDPDLPYDLAHAPGKSDHRSGQN